MEEKGKKMVNTNLGILLICLFSSIFTMTDFIIIDHVLDKYVDYSKCQCTKCDIKDNGVNKDNASVVDDGNVNGTNNNSVSNVFPNSYLNCIEQNGKYCLVKNDTDLKVEVEIDSEHNYVLIVNGNRFLPELGYVGAITNLVLMDDGYIYVEYDVQGLGPRQKAFIIDSNLNVITDITDLDYILGDYNRASIKFTLNRLELSNATYADGGPSLACNRQDRPKNDEIVYVSYNYEYIGNGKFQEINHSTMTFSEKLKEATGYSTCEELNR